MKKFNYFDCNASKTPAVNNLVLTAKKDSQLKKFSPHEICGSLIWLLNTRPDLSYAVSKLGQVASKAPEEFYVRAIRILRYLKGTINIGLRYYCNKKKTVLHGFADSNFAGDKNDRKSQFGFMFFVHDCLIEWGSWKQKVVALSSAEAELIAANEAAKTATWLRQLLKEFQEKQDEATIIYEDNAGTIAMSNTTAFSRRTRHIDVRYHYLNDKVQAGQVILKKIDSKQNLADVFTKPLYWVNFQRLVEKVVTEVTTPPKTSKG